MLDSKNIIDLEKKIVVEDQPFPNASIKDFLPLEIAKKAEEETARLEAEEAARLAEEKKAKDEAPKAEEKK